MGVWRSGSACRLQRRGHRFEPCHAHIRVLKPALSSTNGHWRRTPATGQRTNLLAHPGRATLTVLAPFPPGRWVPRSPLRRPRGRTAARLAACPGRSPDRGLAWLVDTQRRRALGRADPTNCSASLASWSQSRLCRMGMVTHCFMSRPSCRGSKRAPAPEATSSSTRCFGSFTTSSPPLSMAKVLPPTLSPGEEPHPERRIARVSTGSAAPRKAVLGRACPDSHPSWRPPAMGVLSGIDGRALCYPAFSQAVLLRKCRRDGVNCGCLAGLLTPPGVSLPRDNGEVRSLRRWP